MIFKSSWLIASSKTNRIWSSTNPNNLYMTNNNEYLSVESSNYYSIIVAGSSSKAQSNDTRPLH